MVDMMNEIELSPKMCLVNNLQCLRDADEAVDEVQAGRFGVHASLLLCKAIPGRHRWRPVRPKTLPTRGRTRRERLERGVLCAPQVGGVCSFFRTSKLCSPLDTAWRASARALSRKTVSPSVM